MGYRKFQKVKAAAVTSLSICLALSACGQAQPDASGSPEETSAVTSNGTVSLFNEPGVLPMLKEKRTFSIGMAKSANVEDYDTNKFTVFLEENTNIHLQFVLFPEEDAKQKLSIMIKRKRRSAGYHQYEPDRQRGCPIRRVWCVCPLE